VEIGDTSTLAPLPPSTRSVGGGGGWLGPSLSSVLANARAGMGDKGQPLHMTTYLTSQAQQSLNFTSLMVTAFQVAVMDSPLVPFFPLQLDDPVALLPLGARDDRIIGRKAQPHSQSSILITPGGQWLSQWGLGQGTHESALLSPTEEAQFKFPGW
jgi:hypothetical protein